VSKVELKRRKVDLSELARQAAVSLQATAPERSAHFEIAEGIQADGDPDLLPLVLDNLFGNAWKFSSTREDAVIAFGMVTVDGENIYFVRDNGAGFDMAEAGRIFSPFARLSPKGQKGFGIGLATVERIIQRHGGRVWAEGESGKGATFYFTLTGNS
jgi:signal transduction histidine kinase